MLRVAKLMISFLSVQNFLVQALVSFGHCEFIKGGTLSNYRHLVLCCQRWVTSCRPITRPCWDLISKWEIAEPVRHRPPIPEGLVKCLVTAGWRLGWRAWCGVTLLAFYGAGRVGEVLRCSRGDLVFPVDMLDSGFSGIYLCLKRFKSLGRQPAKVQHMQILDGRAVKLLGKIFKDYPAEALLYAGSPSAFRRRWDFLLTLCEVPSKLNLTPGGLRGGAAAWLYKRKTPVADIVWRLRLRSQSTLESYLQETAALSVLQQMDSHTLKSLELVAQLYEFL